MAYAPTLLALLLTASSYVDAQNACSVRHDTACVAAMRSFYASTSAFWFGTEFAMNCPPGTGGVLCTNTKPSGTSLLTRMLGNTTTDASGLAFVVNVTYTIALPPDGSDRTYPGCGRIVDVPLTGPQTFSIDTLDNTAYTSFDLAQQPEVTWPAEESALYTVIWYDAGPCFIHGLYVNVVGGRLDNGDTIESYIEPGNPGHPIIPYVWIVFKQQRPLDAANAKNIYDTLYSRGQWRVYVEDLVSQLGLSTQTYGVNVAKVSLDEYTTVLFRDVNISNRCPGFYGHWLSSYIQQRGGLPSLPAHLNLSVSVDVSFTAPAITYTSCGIVYEASPVNITVDYRSRDLLSSVETRTSPQVSLVPVEIRDQPPSVTLRDKQYTLLMYDPTGELGQTDQNAYIHWMVVNIRGTDITSGDVVYSWLMPLSSRLNQLYLFALFEQRATISTTTEGSFGGTDCHPYLDRRCKFRAGDFIRYNNLSLVGMRYLRVIPDTYRQYVAYVVAQFESMDQVCWGQERERPPCPTNSGSSETNIGIIMSLLTVLATRLTFIN
ncbi:uncharacterized protein LOC124274826 [Haliotis rubra]|uniref:uncharacterized protein LOC124274826 n=1 Tax=Haliotis rubra TaxID=36100 RepID=UPI001EE5FB03|nr:uncharacterized protein LOC124274826 [Haliotis rubra]